MEDAPSVDRAKTAKAGWAATDGAKHRRGCGDAAPGGTGQAFKRAAMLPPVPTVGKPSADIISAGRSGQSNSLAPRVPPAAFAGSRGPAAGKGGASAAAAQPSAGGTSSGPPTGAALLCAAGSGQGISLSRELRVDTRWRFSAAPGEPGTGGTPEDAPGPDAVPWERDRASSGEPSTNSSTGDSLTPVEEGSSTRPVPLYLPPLPPACTHVTFLFSSSCRC